MAGSIRESAGTKTLTCDDVRVAATPAKGAAVGRGVTTVAPRSAASFVLGRRTLLGSVALAAAAGCRSAEPSDVDPAPSGPQSAGGERRPGASGTTDADTGAYADAAGSGRPTDSDAADSTSHGRTGVTDSDSGPTADPPGGGTHSIPLDDQPMKAGARGRSARAR